MKILLLTKTSELCKEAQHIVQSEASPEDILDIKAGEFGDKFPSEIEDWSGELVISFLCPWIIPAKLLENAKTAINFHPAPPKYPGIGCYNFAIYNRDDEYGVTCHHMAAMVDSGRIIKVLRFKIKDDETVASLKAKSMDALMELFKEVCALALSRKELPASDDDWERKPYTRKDLQELCKITPNMSADEIALRIRSCYFPGARDRPFVEMAGKKFILEDKQF